MQIPGLTIPPDLGRRLYPEDNPDKQKPSPILKSLWENIVEPLIKALDHVPKDESLRLAAIRKTEELLHYIADISHNGLGKSQLKEIETKISRIRFSV